MSGRSETSTSVKDPETEAVTSGSGSVALIGPNATHRKIMANALAGSAARSVREFADYPARLGDVPRLLEQHFEIFMIDVDSDESYALALVEKISTSGNATVIAYSSRNDPALMALCLRAGARDFLPLPEESQAHHGLTERTAFEEQLPQQIEEPASYARGDQSTAQPIREFTRDSGGNLVSNTPPKPVEYRESFAAETPTAEVAPFRPMQPASIDPVEESLQFDADTKPLANSVDEWDAVHLRLMQQMRGQMADPTPRAESGHVASRKIKDIWAATPLPPPPPPVTVKAVEERASSVDSPEPPKKRERWSMPFSKAPSLSIRPTEDRQRIEATPEPPKKKDRAAAKSSSLSIKPVEDAPRSGSVPDLPANSKGKWNSTSPSTPSNQSNRPIVDAPRIESAVAVSGKADLTPAREPLPPQNEGVSPWQNAPARAVAAVNSKSPVPSLPESSKGGVSQSWLDEIIDTPQSNARPRPKFDPSMIEPLIKYEEPEKSKGTSQAVHIILLAAGLGVLASLAIVYFLHPFGQVSPAPVPAQAVQATPAVHPVQAPPEAVQSPRTVDASHPDWTTIASLPDTPAKASGSSAGSADRVSSEMMNAQLTAPTLISSDMKRPKPVEEAPSSNFNPGEMENGSTLPSTAINGVSKVKVEPAGAAISAGVAEGLLTHRVPVTYPEFARTSHIGGTVVIGATITKAGTLSGLHVVSGPAALRSAAMESVKNWRYRPYMLNNEPIDVNTIISVVFKLDNQ